MISLIGDLVIVDDDDERLVLTAAGTFHGEVIPEDSEGGWRSLNNTEELVEFYDPTDVFGDLADALAEAYPSVAPEMAAAEEADDAAEQSGQDDESDGGDGTAEAPEDEPTA